MRNNFWKWLKRFFIVLPILVMIIGTIFRMGEYWNHNATNSYTFGDYDIIGSFIYDGFENGFNNPLIFNYGDLPDQSILYNVHRTFLRVYSIITGDGDYVNLYDYNSYVYLTLNFLTWWIFVELVFLFFRFVTFLISWVNSLFDNTFKKIRK